MSTPVLQVMRRDGARPASDLEPLLTAEEVAGILGVRTKRVYELGIPCLRLSARSIRYRPAAVAAWLESRRTVA